MPRKVLDMRWNGQIIRQGNEQTAFFVFIALFANFLPIPEFSCQVHRGINRHYTNNLICISLISHILRF